MTKQTFLKLLGAIGVALSGSGVAAAPDIKSALMAALPGLITTLAALFHEPPKANPPGAAGIAP